MKASLVIKPTVLSEKISMESIRKIVVNNKIPVTKVGVSSKGNAFIHCPSAEIRDELESHLVKVPNQKVHAIKDRLPSISNAGFTQPIEKDTLVKARKPVTHWIRIGQSL